MKNLLKELNRKVKEIRNEIDHKADTIDNHLTRLEDMRIELNCLESDISADVDKLRTQTVELDNLNELITNTMNTDTMNTKEEKEDSAILTENESIVIPRAIYNMLVSLNKTYDFDTIDLKSFTEFKN